jgi:hypothetical protein
MALSALGQARVECAVDRGAVGDDATLEVHERGNAIAARPFDPSVECDLAFVAPDREVVAQSFFEEVGAPESRVGLGDPVELVTLQPGDGGRLRGWGDGLSSAGGS